MHKNHPICKCNQIIETDNIYVWYHGQGFYIHLEMTAPPWSQLLIKDVHLLTRRQVRWDFFGIEAGRGGNGFVFSRRFFLDSDTWIISSDTNGLAQPEL